MELNKNISVWRGNNTPPTNYHLWEKDDILYVYSDDQWKELASTDYQNQIKELQIEATGQIGDDYEQSYQLKLRGTQQGDTIKIPKIKTINGQSILGSGDLSIAGTEGATPDKQMSDTSKNAVENRVVKAYIDNSRITIIVDNECEDSSYTLDTAVATLLNKQKSTGTKYIQHGTIISYTKANGLMESKQYTGSSDGSDISKWITYGGDRQVTLTQDEYNKLVIDGTIDEDTYYNILEN